MFNELYSVGLDFHKGYYLNQATSGSSDNSAHTSLEETYKMTWDTLTGKHNENCKLKVATSPFSRTEVAQSLPTVRFIDGEAMAQEMNCVQKAINFN